MSFLEYRTEVRSAITSKIGPEPIKLEKADIYAFSQTCIKCNELLTNSKRINYNHTDGVEVITRTFPQHIYYICQKRSCSYENALFRLCQKDNRILNK